MKNFKAYVRTTLAASLVLTTGLLTAAPVTPPAPPLPQPQIPPQLPMTPLPRKRIKIRQGRRPIHRSFRGRHQPILEEQGYTFTEVEFLLIFCRMIWH